MSVSTRKTNRRPYRPLGALFWACFLLLSGTALAMAGRAAWSRYEHLKASPEARGEVLALSGGKERGVFATFYGTADFSRPIQSQVLPMKFSYRTEFELQRLKYPTLSGRFSAGLNVPKAGKYRFLVDANDGARIWINNEKIFDDWNSQAIHQAAGELTLPKGDVPLYVEWYNHSGNGWLGILWEGPGLKSQFLPVEALTPDPYAGRPE